MLGKFKRSMKVKMKSLKRSRGGENLLGRVLGEKLKQIFCHESNLVLKIAVAVYLEVLIFWCFFFKTLRLCECLPAFCNSFCNFRRPPFFDRAIDAAKENGRNGSIIEVFGESVGSFRERDRERERKRERERERERERKRERESVVRIEKGKQ